MTLVPRSRLCRCSRLNRLDILRLGWGGERRGGERRGGERWTPASCGIWQNVAELERLTIAVQLITSVGDIPLLHSALYAQNNAAQHTSFSSRLQPSWPQVDYSRRLETPHKRYSRRVWRETGKPSPVNFGNEWLYRIYRWTEREKREKESENWWREGVERNIGELE